MEKQEYTFFEGELPPTFVFEGLEGPDGPDGFSELGSNSQCRGGCGHRAEKTMCVKECPGKAIYWCGGEDCRKAVQGIAASMVRPKPKTWFVRAKENVEDFLLFARGMLTYCGRNRRRQIISDE